MVSIFLKLVFISCDGKDIKLSVTKRLGGIYTKTPKAKKLCAFSDANISKSNLDHSHSIVRIITLKPIYKVRCLLATQCRCVVPGRHSWVERGARDDGMQRRLGPRQRVVISFAVACLFVARISQVKT